MKKIIYREGLESIKKLIDVFTFKSEELVINLSELENFLAEEVNNYIIYQEKTLAIYSKDNIDEVFKICDMCKFFTNINNQFVEVPFLNSLNINNIYIKSPVIKLYSKIDKPIALEVIFGKDISFNRSLKAIRKIISVWTIASYLKHQPVHLVNNDFNLPALPTILSIANFELWKEYTIQTTPGIKFKFGNKLLSQPTEENFNWELLDFLGKNFQLFFETIKNFISKNFDCLYTIEVKKDKLSIIRGIDYKYIPHYEQKFLTNN